MGLVWALGNPLMAAPDEPAHAIKAAAVANGDLTTESTEAPFGFQTAPMSSVEVPAAYAALNSSLRCFGPPVPAPVPCLDDTPIGTDRSIATGSTYVGAYQPVYYAMVGWPSRVASPELALRLMRVIAVLTCSALLASGFSSARQMSRGRGPRGDLRSRHHSHGCLPRRIDQPQRRRDRGRVLCRTDPAGGDR